MDSITITKDQFNKAVVTANQQFSEKGKNCEHYDETANFLMGVQNILFASILANVLFDNAKSE